MASDHRVEAVRDEEMPAKMHGINHRRKAAKRIFHMLQYIGTDQHVVVIAEELRCKANPWV